MNANLSGKLTKEIWQTAPKKVGNQVKEVMNTWKQVPGWKYNFMDDDEVKNYLSKRFPMINFDQVYDQKKILAFDLFRYAIIYDKGGIYADSDFQVGNQFQESMERLKHCNVIIGVEADLRHAGNRWKEIDMARPFQLAQWSFYAMPKHPLLRHVLNRVTQQIEYYQERSLNLRDYPVLEITGPGIWTDAVIDYLSITTGVYIKEQFKCGPSYQINDVCILNVKAFSLDMEHTCHKEKEADSFYIGKHYFNGSWKNNWIGNID